MRSRLYAAALSSVFLFLFIWCPLVYILNKTGAVKITEIENSRPAERVYENGILSGFLNQIETGKAKLDNLYTNYLPLYSEIVTVLGSVNTDMQMSFSDMLAKKTKNPQKNEKSPEEEKTEFSAVMLIDDGLHRYYAIRPFDFIDTALSFSEDTLFANMDTQIGHINRIGAATAGMGASFYLYVGKRMQDAEYFSEIIPAEKSTAPYFREFMDRIKETNGKCALNVDTLEKRLENIFRTDHHWSALGAYSGYCDIINMINKNSPEIGPPVPLSGLIAYESVNMRGSASRISSFPRFTETFSVMDIKLPAGHQQFRVTDNAGKYEKGSFDKSMYADHYALYYNYKSEYIYPENKTGRNLLIIGDSFTWWSSWLIAANFDRTYVYYPWDRKKLDYGGFIEENGITDVLMMLFSDRAMFNIYGDCPLENIKTE